MKVTVSRLGRSTKGAVPSKQLIKRVIETVLRSEKIQDRGEISVVFVGHQKIRQLHRSFLKDSTTTDVITFPYKQEPHAVKDAPFGDIYICLPQAHLNAKEYNQSIKTELIRLIIHGVLHLLGYTDHKPKEKKTMWAKQEMLLKKINS